MERQVIRTTPEVELDDDGRLSYSTQTAATQSGPQSSVNSDGKYCGLNEATGTMEIMPPDKVGYCGPTCAHCADLPVYALQNGIWCCAADYEYEGD